MLTRLTLKQVCLTAMVLVGSMFGSARLSDVDHSWMATSGNFPIEICDSPGNSCHGRCGFSKETSQNIILPRIEVTCSCDSMCTAYNDCCWNFRSICFPEIREFRRSHPEFSSRKAPGLCWSGSLVVGTCEERDAFSYNDVLGPSYEGFLAQKEFRPVVTHIETNTNYADTTVYACVYNQSSFDPPNDAFVEWDLIFKAETEPSLATLEDAMTHSGNHSEFWERHVHSEPQTSISKVRQCARPLSVNLTCTSSRLNLKLFEQTVQDVAASCRVLYPNSEPASIGTTDVTSTPISRSTQLPRGLSLTTVDLRPVDSLGPKKCTCNQYPLPEPPVGFRARLEVSRHKIHLRVVASAQKNYEEVFCTRDQASSKTCTFNVVCGPGKIYHDGICMQMLTLLFRFTYYGEQATEDQALIALENNPYFQLTPQANRNHTGKEESSDDNSGSWRTEAIYVIKPGNLMESKTFLNLTRYLWDEIEGLGIIQASLCFGNHSDPLSLLDTATTVLESEAGLTCLSSPDRGNDGRQTARLYSGGITLVALVALISILD